MHRTFSAFVTLCLVFWLMPLGAFIKPSQEKTACDGKRAFHMCSMMSGGETAGAAKSYDGMVKMSNASGVEKTSKTSVSSGGDDLLLLAVAASAANNPSLRFQREENTSLQFLLNRPVEPPPKTLLFSR